MTIAVIVLAVAVLLLGGGLIFLTLTNKAQGATISRISEYAIGLQEVIDDRGGIITELKTYKDGLEKSLEKMKWELDAAHGLLERLVVFVPDDALLFTKEKMDDINGVIDGVGKQSSDSTKKELIE